jgi:hypothetical protein
VLGIKDSGVIFAEEGEVVIPKELDDSNGTSLIARNVLCERDRQLVCRMAVKAKKT